MASSCQTCDLFGKQECCHFAGLSADTPTNVVLALSSALSQYWDRLETGGGEPAWLARYPIQPAAHALQSTSSTFVDAPCVDVVDVQRTVEIIAAVLFARRSQGYLTDVTRRLRMQVSPTRQKSPIEQDWTTRHIPASTSRQC